MRMTQFLTQDIPPEIRRAALTAVTTTPQLVRRWVQEFGCDDKRGCPEVTTAFAAINQPIDPVMINRLLAFGGNSAVEEQLSEMLGGIPTRVLREAWVSWDAGSDEDRAACLAICRATLDAMDGEVEDDHDDAPDIPVPFKRERVNARALVSTIGAMVLMATIMLV